MKTILSRPVLALCALALAGNTHAQSLQWHQQLTGNAPNWSRCYDMTLDANGNVFVVGVFHGIIDFGNGPVSSTLSGNDFYFAMYNSTGTLLLFKKIGEANAQVVGQGVSLFNSGGTVFLYVTGHFISLSGQLFSVNFDPNGDPSGLLSMNDTEGDAFVAKYNVTNGGTFVWARRIANTRAWGSGGKIATDAAGNAYTVSNESPGPTEKSRIARHSVNGNPDWNLATNGMAYDVAFRGTSVFVCGKSLSIANGRALARLNASNGNLQSTFGSISQEFWALALDSNNGIYVVGKNGINAVMKFTTGTSPIWTKTFDASSGPSIEFDIAVAGPNQNQVVVTGSFTGTVNFNGADGGSEFAISSTGPYRDIFAARYNSSTGNCLWVKSYPRQLPGGATYPLAAAGNAQNFLITGHVSMNAIDIDFCAGVVNVAANNTDNAFIAQYSLLSSHSVTISGPFAVCIPGSSHTVNAYGGTITWSVSPANLVVNASGSGSTANLQAKPRIKGQATLTFTINGAVDDCGMPVSGSVDKILWIGPPNGGIAGPTTVYPGSNYFYEAATHYSLDGAWYSLDIEGGLILGINDNMCIAHWTDLETGTGTLILHSTNICGTTVTELEVTITLEGGCNPCQIMQTYPNPVSDELSIVFLTDEESETDKKQEQSENEVALMNSNQQVVYSTVTKANEVSVQTADMPEGMYFLKARNKHGSETKQIWIKH